MLGWRRRRKKKKDSAGANGRHLLWRTTPTHGRRTIRELAPYLWTPPHQQRMLRPTVMRLMQRILPVYEAAPGHYAMAEVSLIRRVAHVAYNLLPSGMRCVQAALLLDAAPVDTTAGAAVTATAKDSLPGSATGTSGSSSSNTITGSRASEQRGDQ